MSHWTMRLMVFVGLNWLLTAATAVHAETHTSPAGYTVQIPDGWTAASISNVDQLSEEIRVILKEKNVDLKQIDLMVLGPQEFGQIVANFNVVVTPGQIPVARMSIEEFTTVVKGEYEKVGVKISNFTARKVNVSGREAFEANYDPVMPWDTVPIRQRQVVIPGGGRTFTVTFTSSTDSYKQDAVVFDAVQQSLQVPAPTLSTGIFSGMTRGAIIGGIAGGLGAALSMLLKKKKQTNAGGE